MSENPTKRWYMPTARTVSEIEDFLLGLVARDRGITVEEVRQEGERCPYDPPWNSEEFVHYQAEIEEEFGIDFDPIEVEVVQRSVARLAAHIRDLVERQVQQTA